MIGPTQRLANILETLKHAELYHKDTYLRIGAGIEGGAFLCCYRTMRLFLELLKLSRFSIIKMTIQDHNNLLARMKNIMQR